MSLNREAGTRNERHLKGTSASLKGTLHLALKSFRWARPHSVCREQGDKGNSRCHALGVPFFPLPRTTGFLSLSTSYSSLLKPCVQSGPGRRRPGIWGFQKVLKVQRDQTNHPVQDGKETSFPFLVAIQDKRPPRGPG